MSGRCDLCEQKRRTYRYALLHCWAPPSPLRICTGCREWRSAGLDLLSIGEEDDLDAPSVQLQLRLDRARPVPPDVAAEFLW